MMNFFRLRVINTLLFFLIGTLIGFVLKERFFPRTPQVSQPRYQPEYAVQPEMDQPAAQTEQEPEAAEEAAPEPEPPAAKYERTPPPASEPARATAAEKSAPVVIETSVVPEEDHQDPGGHPVVKGSQDDFFSSHGEYIGKDLEMELQMITAKRSQRGWRLNFVYAGPDKKIDYLYVDDNEILGEKPDLRIGYVYRIRFHCSKGETASGNTLTLLTPTGEKAPWATGLSALE